MTRPRKWLLAGVLPIALLAGELAAQSRLGARVRGFRSPGNHPEGLCWDGTHLWSNNFTDGALYKLRPEDGQVLRRYQQAGLPVNPEGLAWDGEHLWTCDWQTGNIFKLRETAEGLRILGVFPKPAGSGGPVGLEWDGTHLWLTTWASEVWDRGQLYQLDPVTLEPVKMLRLPVYWVEDLAWDGRYLWSSDWLFAVGFAIDTATGDTLHTYRTPGPHPVGHAWDGEFLWQGDTSSDSLWALDMSALPPTVVHRLRWGEVKRFFGGPER